MKGQGWRTIRRRTAVWRMMQRAKRKGSLGMRNRAGAKKALALLAKMGAQGGVSEVRRGDD